MIEELNKVYCADAIEILKQLPCEMFDCVVSDVPYKIKTGGARVSEESIDKFGKTDPKGIFNRVVTNDRLKAKWLKQNNAESALLVAEGKLFKHCNIKFTDWLPEVFRVLKEGTHAYFMVNGCNLKELQSNAEAVGFKFVNLLVWEKQNATPNKYFMQKCEFILMLRKGKARNINNMGKTNVFHFPNIIGNKFHPTEKPVELMKELILASTNELDLILEPFAGSGSTCLAAKETNRQFLGIEIDAAYCEIANKRLNNEIQRKEPSQGSLFTK